MQNVTDIREVAIKHLYITKINESKSEVKNIKLKSTETEDKILRLFTHPNILPCLDVYQNKDFKVIVTKYCNQGNLAQMIRKYKGFEKEHAVYVIHQISMALSVQTY